MFYTPLVEENDYINQQSTSFLNRFYDGDISAMLSDIFRKQSTIGNRAPPFTFHSIQKFRLRRGIYMIDFIIHFLICNLLISGMIGILFCH